MRRVDGPAGRSLRFLGVKILENPTIRFVADAFVRWDRYRAPTLSAAMAFYVLISIAPLTVVAVGILGSFLDEAVIRGQIIDAIAGVVGPDTTGLLEQILSTRWVRRSDPVGGVLAVLTLVIASTAGFNHLRASLNQIFESPETGRGPILRVIRGRLLAFVVVVAFGATILVSLILRTLLAALGALLEQTLPIDPSIFHTSELLLFLVLLTGIFAFLFRFLPDRKMPRRPLLAGSLVTAILFLAGEWAIGLYLGRVSLGSAFGVAGSAVILAAWVYYSSMVFFLGAAVTAVYADHREVVVAGPSAPSPEVGGS